jgi:hypothetical protein
MLAEGVAGPQNEALQQTRSALTTIAAALAAERRCWTGSVQACGSDGPAQRTTAQWHGAMLSYGNGGVASRAWFPLGPRGRRHSTVLAELDRKPVRSSEMRAVRNGGFPSGDRVSLAAAP